MPAEPPEPLEPSSSRPRPLTQFVVVNAVGALRANSLFGVVLGALVAVGALSALWLGVSSLLPHGTATPTERIPGALLYGVGSLALYLFDTIVVGWLIEVRVDTYGALGAAAALLFSMYLTGRLIVGPAVLNATVSARARS